MTALKEPESARSVQLALLSAAVLYLELALIRFTAAEVLYLGYFSNFVLISVFVGLGLGFLSAKRESDLSRFLQSFPLLFVFLFGLVLISRFDATSLTDHGGLFFFGNITQDGAVPGVILLPILFLAIAGCFLLLGQQAGRLFLHFTPLKAYALDIAGSLFGIALFSFHSFTGSGPVTWVVSGCFLLAMAFAFSPDDQGPSRRAAIQVAIAGAFAVCFLSAGGSAAPAVWSPYQKLVVQRQAAGGPLLILANGVPHQFIIAPEEARAQWYDLPYSEHLAGGGRLKDVLVVGSGAGTDVGVALLRGPESVDAVEIDPGIAALGQAFNQASPYQDPRVSVHVTDGRAFIRRARKKYDVIIFALPDSLMRISSFSNVRLESYLFTLECFQEVKKLLKPGGSFFLYNQYRWGWLKNKIAAMLESAFGRSPRIIEAGATTVLGVGERLRGSAYSKTGYEKLATDDWPQVYMQSPQVSWFYLCMIAMFLTAALLGVFILSPKGALVEPDWPFFFMGAAFLLLEAKSIALFALLFGTTWVVNSLVFAGILMSVLLANLIVSIRAFDRRRLLFLGLLLCVLAAYLCRPSMLLGIENVALRYALAIGLYFSPIFLANLIFSREFRDFKASQIAFGWNLLGAVFGGGLEYLGLRIGNRNLLWVVLFFYLLTAILLHRRDRGSKALGL